MVHYVECIKNFGTTDNYNTEMFEHFHIDMAKEGWRASNFHDEVLQMTKWLTRQEKVTMFESYLHCYTNENDLEAEDLASLPSKSGIGLNISQHPSTWNQSLTSIQSHHNCPSLSQHLHVYLNSLMPPGQSIPQAQVSHANLPFDSLDIWHTCKFGLDVLGNDIDGQEGIDAVKSKPERGGGRFDVVAVANTLVARATGLEGKNQSDTSN